MFGLRCCRLYGTLFLLLFYTFYLYSFFDELVTFDMFGGFTIRAVRYDRKGSNPQSGGRREMLKEMGLQQPPGMQQEKADVGEFVWLIAY